MDNSPHAHYYTLFWWALFLSIGTFFEIMVYVVIVANLPDLLSGKISAGDAIGLAFMGLVALPFALLAQCVPFIMKIVVSDQGIEYHTIAYIYRARWRDLINRGMMPTGRAGVSVILASYQPEVIVRSWARQLPWDIPEGAARRGIPTSDFEAIRQAALDYVEGWYGANPERMQRCLHPDLAKRAVKRDSQTKRDSLYHLTREQMVTRTAEGGGTGTAIEKRYTHITIFDVYEGIASVKAEMYDYVDYLHIARFEGRWVIVNVLYTRNLGAI
jgi:hypothetical protein